MIPRFLRSAPLSADQLRYLAHLGRGRQTGNTALPLGFIQIQ